MTVTCIHCGVVAVTEPSSVRHIARVLDAFAVGAAPLAAITCPQCSEEIFTRDVIRDASGRSVAPLAGNVLPERPDGPWTENGR